MPPVAAHGRGPLGREHPRARRPGAANAHVTRSFAPRRRPALARFKPQPSCFGRPPRRSARHRARNLPSKCDFIKAIAFPLDCCADRRDSDRHGFQRVNRASRAACQLVLRQWSNLRPVEIDERRAHRARWDRAARARRGRARAGRHARASAGPGRAPSLKSAMMDRRRRSRRAGRAGRRGQGPAGPGASSAPANGTSPREPGPNRGASSGASTTARAWSASAVARRLRQRRPRARRDRPGPPRARRPVSTSGRRLEQRMGDAGPRATPLAVAVRASARRFEGRSRVRPPPPARRAPRASPAGRRLGPGALLGAAVGGRGPRRSAGRPRLRPRTRAPRSPRPSRPSATRSYQQSVRAAASGLS